MEEHIDIPNYGHIAYTDEGQGKAVIFIHGFCNTKEVWDKLRMSLINRYRIITVDTMGHGHSLPAEGFDFSMRSQAEAILQLLQLLKLREVFWIGHSMGGYITLAAARLQPEMFKGVILFHSTAAPDTQEKKENRNKTIEVVLSTPEVFIREFYYNLFAPDNKSRFTVEIEQFKTELGDIKPDYIAATLRGLRDREDSEPALKALDVPKHYIIGRYDQVIPAAPLAEQIKNVGATYSVLEKSGHLGFLEEPEESEKIISGYLEKNY